MFGRPGDNHKVKIKEPKKQESESEEEEELDLNAIFNKQNQPDQSKTKKQ